MPQRHLSLGIAPSDEWVAYEPIFLRELFGHLSNVLVNLRIRAESAWPRSPVPAFVGPLADVCTRYRASSQRKTDAASLMSACGSLLYSLEHQICEYFPFNPPVLAQWPSVAKGQKRGNTATPALREEQRSYKTNGKALGYLVRLLERAVHTLINRW